MKCPNCNQEMRVIDIVTSYSNDCYVLDEETGRYMYIYDENLEEEADIDYCCGECGFQLPETMKETIDNLTLD